MCVIRIAVLGWSIWGCSSNRHDVNCLIDERSSLSRSVSGTLSSFYICDEIMEDSVYTTVASGPQLLPTLRSRAPDRLFPDCGSVLLRIWWYTCISMSLWPDTGYSSNIYFRAAQDTRRHCFNYARHLLAIPYLETDRLGYFVLLFSLNRATVIFPLPLRCK